MQEVEVIRGQPKSVRAPSWRSQVVSALQELSKTLRSFRTCARLHTHAQTHTLAHTHSHPLPPTPETLGELKARALRSSPQPSSRGSPARVCAEPARPGGTYSEEGARWRRDAKRRAGRSDGAELPRLLNVRGAPRTHEQSAGQRRREKGSQGQGKRNEGRGRRRS